MPPRRTRQGGFKERWCVVLEAVLAPESNERRSGVSVIQVMDFKTGDLRIIGVAARRSARDRPVMFNVCPFCGEPLDWHFKGQKKARYV
jgi:hypothetical protein